MGPVPQGSLCAQGLPAIFISYLSMLWLSLLTGLVHTPAALASLRIPRSCDVPVGVYVPVHVCGVGNT